MLNDANNYFHFWIIWSLAFECFTLSVAYFIFWHSGKLLLNLLILMHHKNGTPQSSFSVQCNRPTTTNLDRSTNLNTVVKKLASNHRHKWFSTYGFKAQDREMSTRIRSLSGVWWTLPLPYNCFATDFYVLTLVVTQWYCSHVPDRSKWRQLVKTAMLTHWWARYSMMMMNGVPVMAIVA